MQRIKISNKQMAVASCFVLLIVYLLIAFFKKGSGDAGDSIEHYLISRYAYKYPEFFLHHWGKPLFVLLTAPFAQFGFTGIKVFNVFIAILTAWFTYSTAEELKLKHSAFIPLLLACSPLYFVLIFSGLTEHLFAFILILSLYLEIKNKTIAPAVLISFLPFVRSEGLIIIAVFLLYYLISSRYKRIPLLLSGHLVYGLAGLLFYHHDFFWTFKQIPYLKLSSTYGDGGLFDFFSKLYYVTGFPVYALLVLGLILAIIAFFRKPFPYSKGKGFQKLFLVYGSFAAFFVAHSLFWYLGIFNSMGLGRVMIAVMPLVAIIAIEGLDVFPLVFSHNIARSISIVFIVYVLVFPFTDNPAAVDWDKELDPDPAQNTMDQIAEFIEGNLQPSMYYYAHPYFGISLGIDPYDEQIRKKIMFSKIDLVFPDHSLFIWDSWFSVVEEGVEKQSLETMEGVYHIADFKANDKNNTCFSLFEYRSTGIKTNEKKYK